MITHDNVSIHAPARGATSWEYAPETGVYMFQFTLPRGERQSFDYRRYEPYLFQFTLPRGERLTEI